VAVLADVKRSTGGTHADDAAIMDHRFRRWPFSTRATLAWSLGAVAQSVLGVRPLATIFVPPLLLVGLRSLRMRAAGLMLALGPPAVEFATRRPRMGPATWPLASIADGAAYGLGVWLGCMRRRTLDPLRPRVAWHRAHA
jgi:hypothetical protein